MNRGKKLSDGKSISGKNRLTDKFIDTITTYYGNAIRQNNSSVSDMRQTIWAIYCHYRSTDEEPMHYFCPIGDTSWCKYQKAVAINSAFLFKHKNIVPIAIVDKIKPIIAELSAPNMLKNVCGEGGNSKISKFCEKLEKSDYTIEDQQCVFHSQDVIVAPTCNSAICIVIGLMTRLIQMKVNSVYRLIPDGI
ncbi:uncharacterized protein TNCV_4785831 [Trichonephila clavipes]|nr:uncharacterized protein TNCV_4785831 [Trichonephila clavipes]